MWLKSGRSIYKLQQRLCHTSIKTTEMYLQYLTQNSVSFKNSSDAALEPGDLGKRVIDRRGGLQHTLLPVGEHLIPRGKN
jgi:hypothetical protein